MKRRAQGLVLASLALTLLATPARGQQTIGVSMNYLGYSFDDGLGAQAAQLFMVPVAVRFPFQRVTVDLYSAWAQGQVERDDVAYTLQGVVDTRVKLSYQATPWALVSVGASLPTGNSTHDGEEAVVASVLAMDLLGFQETTWGAGARVTSSVATAMRAGEFGVGLAAAYTLNGEFEPYVAETPEDVLKYRPGNEARVRIGIDRNFGGSTFTAGATFMTYAEDKANDWNLFQAGNRLRFDATYAFRAGAGVWTLYAADLWREHGDLNLPIEGDAGAIVGDSTFVTPSQNLVVAGVIGAVSVGSRTFRPQMDLRIQTRKEDDGRDEGSGWLLGVGGDIPLRVFGSYDFFPKARVIFGGVKDPGGTSRGVLGAELGGTIRWGF